MRPGFPADPVAIARRFWAGGDCSFPRDIERAVLMTLPLTIARLPVLDEAAVAGQLQRWGAVRPVSSHDRALRGCLVVYRGHGIVFMDGGDDRLEQRLTLAHETAHFLLDYLAPRAAVLKALGESATEVLDGQRPPTIAERATAVLRHIRLGAHVHLLARDEAADASVAGPEARADELALELLAPRVDLTPRLALVSDIDAAATELSCRYGLPESVFGPTLRHANRVRPPSYLLRALTAARKAQ